MMKKYVIFTCDIHPVGGMQLYVDGKTKFLEKNGYNVDVFFPGATKGKCAYSDLSKYIDNGEIALLIPPGDYVASKRKKIVDRIVSKIFSDSKSYDEILIESNNDVGALWAELVSKEINAKHICFNCNELFRGTTKYYSDYIDFFKFKYDRREIVGLRPDTMTRIFEGYYDIGEDVTLMFDAVEPNPIQNIENKLVEQITKKDYNIMYLGRAEKGYVPNIIDGVRGFAKNHTDKNIQFIIVGNALSRESLIKEKLGDLKNVSIVFTGDLVPIPKSIYSKLDVVIAGAVCAEISAREGVPTIVADCSNYLANGVLGYTVGNSMYAEVQTTQTYFDEALEQVLIKKDYNKYPYTFPEQEPIDEIYGSQFRFFLESTGGDEYYTRLVEKSTKRFQYLRHLFYKVDNRNPMIGNLIRKIRK